MTFFLVARAEHVVQPKGFSLFAFARFRWFLAARRPVNSTVRLLITLIMKTPIAFAISLIVVATSVGAERASNSSPPDKPKGGIAGRTTDPNGAVVVGARITIVARSTKTIVSLKSNDVGEYIADLKPDVYDVEADADGFKKATRKAIPVSGEARSFVAFVLEPKPPFDSRHP